MLFTGCWVREAPTSRSGLLHCGASRLHLPPGEFSGVILLVRPGICRRRSPLSKTVCSSDERIDDARLDGSMTGIENDLESRFRPGAMQTPGICHRTNHVVQTLHAHSRKVSEPT